MVDQASQGVSEPDVDIKENETEYTIQAALPGMSVDDINVQVTQDWIRLSAECRSSNSAASDPGKPDGTKNGQQSEQKSDKDAAETQAMTTQHRQGNFARVRRFEFSYTMPEEINPDGATAAMRNGILELHLPKARPASAQARPITVPILTAGQFPQTTGGSTKAMDGSQKSLGSEDAAQHKAGMRSDGNANSKSGKPQPDQQTQPGPATAAKR